MDRKKFLSRSLLTGAAIAAAPVVAVAAARKPASTYDRMLERIGFNHLPNEEIKTMKSVLHQADTRGMADHGWLKSRHSFSFANYHHPERMHFGVLRVLNDDIVDPAKGFGTHPHDNMEIISIPLEGDLEHKDSMGNVATIREGDVQVMSAGTGIYHSEYNKNKDKPVKFLQIWVFPKVRNVPPRYDQISIRDLEVKNKFFQVLSPDAGDQGVWVHQDAWFHLGRFEEGQGDTYALKKTGNGVYAFVISGEVEIEGQRLGPRDGFGVWDTDKVNVKATEAAQLLLMEVPMQISRS